MCSLSKIFAMEDNFKIYVDRLRKGQEEKISFVADPGFLEVPGEFVDEVQISGKAYLADEHLVLKLQLHTEATLPCSICNEPVKLSLAEDFYQTVELAKIPHFVFNFEDLVRDALLLQVPQTVECGEGRCPHREELGKYFAK